MKKLFLSNQILFTGTNISILFLLFNFFHSTPDQTSVPAINMEVVPASDQETLSQEGSFLMPPPCSNIGLNFDGVNDYVETTNPLSGNAAFTFEAWVNTQATNNDFFRYLGMGGSNTRFELGDRNGDLTLFYHPTSTELTGPNVRDGQWHHVAVTYDVSSIKIYLDGVEVITENSPPIFNFSSHWRLGRWAGGSFSGLFNGDMDEVRYWDHARTTQEINDFMNCSLTGQEGGMEIYYNFNTGTPGGNNTGITQITDLTGGGNDGNLLNFMMDGSSSNLICSNVMIFTSADCDTILLAPQILFEESCVSFARPEMDTTCAELCDQFRGGGMPNGGSMEECLITCDSSVQLYRAAIHSGSFYQWHVTGGLILGSSSLDSVFVEWGSLQPASVTLVETNINGCIDSVSVCIEFIESPTADFSYLPATPCINTPIYFNDLSMDATEWFWDFGDGNTSALQNPNHSYTSGGTKTVTLIVKNTVEVESFPFEFGCRCVTECTCTDTIQMNIIVDAQPGPPILCQGTSCVGDTACYKTPVACPGAVYTWTVGPNGTTTSGGTAVDTFICIEWLQGDIGTVELSVSNCTPAPYCPTPTIAQIPIIDPNLLNIVGDTIACQGDILYYSVPKFPGAIYTWEVLGNGGITTNPPYQNSVPVQWNLGAVTKVVVHVEHPKRNCSTTDTLDVSVRPAFSIFGGDQVCFNDVQTYNVLPIGGYTGTFNWTVAGGSFVGSNTGTSVDVDWNISPGNGLLTATPTDDSFYCDTIALYSVEVVALPPTPTLASGPTVICPNSTYAYSATSSGDNIGWLITGGTANPTFGEETLITWSASGPYEIGLYAQSASSPYCSSDTTYIPIVPVTSIVIAGTPSTCVNTTRTYTATISPTGTLPADELIDWSISPITAGSVVSGQGMTSVDILWNNDAGSATLTANYCGNTITDNFSVTLTAATAIISGPVSICNGATGLVDVTGSYTTSKLTCIDNGNIYSPSGSTNPDFTVPGGCCYLFEGTNLDGCEIKENICIPQIGPESKIDPLTSLLICDNGSGPLPTTIELGAINGAGYTFQWQDSCAGSGGFTDIVGATGFKLTLTNPTVACSYRCIIIEGGCTVISNILSTYIDNCMGGPGCTPDPNYTLGFNHTDCGPTINFTATGTSVSKFTWNFDDGFTGIGSNTSHTFDEVGCYDVRLFAAVPEVVGGVPTGDTCSVSYSKIVNIPLMVDWDFQLLNCGSGGTATYKFNDRSQFSPKVNTIDYSWTFNDGCGGAVQTSTLANPNVSLCGMCGNMVSISLQVTTDIGTADACTKTITKNITLSGSDPTAIIPTTACVGEKVTFMDNASCGAIEWLWDFGDGSTSALQNPCRTYTSPNTYTVKLTTTDEFGCDSTIIYPNVITIHPLPTPVDLTLSPVGGMVCEVNTVTFTATPGYNNYDWIDVTNNVSIQSGPSNIYNASTTGVYKVKVTDANNCMETSADSSAIIFEFPTINVEGDQEVCDGTNIQLSAPAGYTYSWDLSGNNLSMIQSLNWSSTPGSYTIDLTLTQPSAPMCSKTFSIPVVIHPNPVPPSIYNTPVPACEGDAVTFGVNSPDPTLDYYWSNGQTGVTITIDPAAEGPISVTGTNPITGCSATSLAKHIFPLPDVCVVPTGCYEACYPDTICLPTGIGSYEWLKDGVALPSQNSLCFEITGSGQYQVVITSFAGCVDTSDIIDMTIISCCEPDSVFCERVDQGFDYSWNGNTLTVTPFGLANNDRWTVDWGDGSSGGNGWHWANVPYIHNYASAGNYITAVLIENHAFPDTILCHSKTVLDTLQNICCLDSLAFCQKIDLGWTVNIDSCSVTVTAPQFDSCHWLLNPIDWGDGSNDTSCTEIDTMEMENDGIYTTDTLACCEVVFNFFTDQLDNGNTYDDSSPMTDIITICPPNEGASIVAIGTLLDLGTGDTLFAYDGADINAPLIDEISGVGPTQIGGGTGLVSANLSSIINPSGCLTFQFVTNGDNFHGQGFDMWVSCNDRPISLDNAWTHTYDSSGIYIICAQVYEGNPYNLDTCWSKPMCDTIIIDGCTPIDTPCVEIVEIIPKEIICGSDSGCYYNPFCLPWLREMVDSAQGKPCVNQYHINYIQKAYYLGQPVIVVNTNIASDPITNTVYNCEGDTLQICHSGIAGTFCTPDVQTVDVLGNITNQQQIWFCGDPLPPLPPDCDQTVGSSYDYCIVVKNNSNAPVTNLVLEGAISGIPFWVDTTAYVWNPPLDTMDMDTIPISIMTGGPAPGDTAKIYISSLDTSNAMTYICDTLCLVLPPCPIDTCCDEANNLILNGAFNGYADGNIPSGSIPWTPSCRSPRIVNTDGCDSLGALQMWGNLLVGECTEQLVNIQAGYTYSLSFCARYVNGGNLAPPWGLVQIRAANTLLPEAGCPGTCEVVYTTDTIDTFDWTQFCFEWTAQNDYDRISIRVINDKNIDDGNYVSRCRIDDVCMELIDTTITCAPIVHCPSDTTLVLGLGDTSIIYTYPPPIVQDSCEGILITYFPPSGSEFACGTTPVECYVYDSLSMDWDTCIFNVIVDCSNTCQVDFDWALDPSCLKVNFDTSNIIGAAPITFTWKFPDNTTSNLTNPMWVAPDTGLYEICLEMIDANGCKDTLCQDVGIYDTTPPEINCPANIFATIPECKRDTSLMFSLPTATDSCGVDSIWCNYGSGFDFPCGITQVTCYARDHYGNVDSCNFNVTVHCLCMEIADTEIMCGDSAAGYDFCIYVAKLNDADGSNCTLTVTSNQPELTIDQQSIVWNNDTAKITGSIGSTRPIPEILNLIVDMQCICGDGFPSNCSRAVNFITPCCDSVYIDGQEICQQDATFHLGLNGTIDFTNIAQTIWYVAPAPCPSSPFGGTPYQVTNGYSDLLLLPNYLTGDVCVYAELIMAQGPCKVLISNLDTIEVCQPVGCTIPDQTYCYFGTPIQPDTLRLAVNQPGGQDCDYTVVWKDPSGNIIPGANSLKYLPPPVNFAGPPDTCFYAVIYTAEITSICGVSSCSATIRLDNDNAAVGQLSITYPNMTMPFCPGQDATLVYDPACVGDPPMWTWHSSTDGITYTPIAGAGNQNPLYNTNRLFQTTWFMVTKQNGVCTQPDSTILKIEIKDELSINQFIAVSNDPCRNNGVNMSVDFGPCTAGNSCSCNYTIDWYKDGQVIHSATYNSSPATFNYLNPALGGDYSGNYYVVITDNCCTQSKKSTVITIDPPMEVIAAGPCTRCFDEIITLDGIVINPVGTGCSYQWYQLISGVEIPVSGGTNSTVQVNTAGTFIFEANCSPCTLRDTVFVQQCDDECMFDTTLPTVLCESSISVNLPPSGQIELTPLDIDDGSFDNCMIDTMYVNGGLIDCSNIPNALVQLVVIDQAGNMNTCWTFVQVTDTNNYCNPPCTKDTINLGPPVLNGTKSFIARHVVNTESVLVQTSNITMKARDAINFLPGFTALPGSTLLARIEDCTAPSSAKEEFDLPESKIAEVDISISEKPFLKVYPNPFTFRATIEFHLTEADEVNISVYTVNGEKVMDLVRQDPRAAGIHKVTLNGDVLRNGMYFIYLQSGKTLLKQKVILIQ